MGWFDVAIPAAIGLLLIGAPGLFSKRTSDANKDASTKTRLRGIGALLLVVAGVYLVIKLVSPR